MSTQACYFDSGAGRHTHGRASATPLRVRKYILHHRLRVTGLSPRSSEYLPMASFVGSYPPQYSGLL